MEIPKALSYARILAIFTIVYNLAEGIISIFFGLSDDSLTLAGFGADSFIEMFSSVGIAHMVWRMRRKTEISRDNFEKTALYITGTGFYLLVASLSFGAVYNFIQGYRPETTVPGIVISCISLLVMWWLIREKLKTGKALDSAAIIADARCAQVCMYMSAVLLLSSGIYKLTGFAWTDSLGALGLAWFSFTEGKECFEKARSGKDCSCEHDHH